MQQQNKRGIHRVMMLFWQDSATLTDTRLIVEESKHASLS